MEEHGIVPDVVDAVPSELIEVKYGDLNVNLGNELTPTQVKDIPTVTWKAEDGAYYLLCMIDPDAPIRGNPVFGQVRHWLVGNIPGNKIEQGETFTEYVGAGPPKDTGLHRYIFLVYKQPGKINYDEPHISSKTRRTRLNFSMKTFTHKYNLGNPVAGNFFQAQWSAQHSKKLSCLELFLHWIIRSKCFLCCYSCLFKKSNPEL